MVLKQFQVEFSSDYKIMAKKGSSEPQSDSASNTLLCEGMERETI